MLKKLLICAISFGIFSTPLRADVTLTVEYREAADLFFLMDNVSEWEKGATDPRYRAEWTKRFGWSVKDQAVAELYREYRNRTMKDVVPEGILPADVAGSDPLAEYFMPQTNIIAALSNFNQSIAAADAKMLQKFYAHFAPKWRVMMEDNKALGGVDKLVDARLGG